MSSFARGTSMGGSSAKAGNETSNAASASGKRKRDRGFMRACNAAEGIEFRLPSFLVSGIIPIFPAMNYYYTADGTNVQGPIALEELTGLFSRGGLPPTTQVCAEG